MSNDRMLWTKPQLIVLAKGMPEENVLLHCKTMNPNQAVSGPTDPVSQDTCAVGEVGNCSNCKSRSVNAT